MRRYGKGSGSQVPAERADSRGERVVMLLENNPYPMDVRVRKEAQSLLRAGHRVEVIAPRAPRQRAREVVDGVSVRRFRAADPTNGGVGARLLEYLIAAVALNVGALRALWRGATVLHLHNPPDIAFPAAGLFRLLGRRVVFDQHDLAPELVAVKYGAGPLVQMARWSERLTFAAAHHVLAANESHADIARGRGHKRDAEVTVVRNGPPVSWTHHPAGLREGRLDPVRLVYLGELAEQDGVAALADILAELRSAHGLRAELTIVGDGEDRTVVESAFARHGLEEAVSFTGWVALEHIPALLAGADIAVDPAPPTELNHHSTMVKVAEYMALGRPVVAYDLLETLRTTAGAAMLVPAGDTSAFASALAQLAAEPALRADLSRRARERAQSLTWEHSERALLGAYAALRRGGAVIS